AATLYQEAAEYATKTGLPYDRRYQARAADTWLKCAEQYVQSSLPVEMAENALLAAASQFSAGGDYARRRTAFEKLAELAPSDRSKKRFGANARRYATAPQEPGDAPVFPDYLKQQHAYADIWFVDLLEWELDGDPFSVAASIVGDLRYPNGIRRRALVVLLTLADAQSRRAQAEPETLVHVAELLGELQSY